MHHMIFQLCLCKCECNCSDPEEHPQTEEYWGRVNPIGARACHDEGKRISETLSYAYQKQVFTLHLFVISVLELSSASVLVVLL